MLVEGGTYSYAMIYTQEKGWSTNFNDLLRAKNIKFSARAEPKGQEQQVARSTITEVVLEMGDRELFNNNFDWSKITSDWDNVESQLLQGTIPFENEVFNRGNLRDALGQMNFGIENGLKFHGPILFYPSMIMDVDVYEGQYEYIKRLPPADQAKVIKFMAAANALKFDYMHKTDLAAELPAHQTWWGDSFNIPFNRLGGIKFLADLGNFVLDVRGNNTLELAFGDAAIIDYPNYPKHELLYKNFMKMLDDFNEEKVPVKYVYMENEAWIRVPPTKETIEKPIKEIQEKGFVIGPPETIVATNDTDPIPWKGWSPIVEASNAYEGKLIQQSDIYYLIFKTYLDNGIRTLGAHSLTDHQDWLNSESDLFTRAGEPKPGFFRVQDLILRY